MDYSYLYLLMTKGDPDYKLVFIVFILPFIGTVLDRLYRKFLSWYEIWRFNTWNYLNFVGYDSIHNGDNYYDYPKPFLAISYYVYREKLSNNLKYLLISKNNKDSTEVFSDKKQNYILDTASDTCIGNSMYIDIYEGSPIETKDTQSNTRTISKTLCLKSQKYNTFELQNFVNKCVEEYEKYIENDHYNKIYHFIYKNKKNSTLMFTSSVLSDLSNDKTKSYESFDHIYNEHKETIIGDIKRLHNVEYFKKYGLKRKKGYLFYGHPGCGKTYTVMAMANHDNRHIIEIPMSRVKTNSEMEDILNLTQIHGVTFNKDQVIYLFDEIDTGGNAIKKRDHEDNEKESKGNKNKDHKESTETESKDKQSMLIDLLTSNNDTYKESTDELNLGTLLSRTDGIGNYNGPITVATTNCKDKLSPALYRHGRLDPIFFDYARKIDIQMMIEKFYNIKLTTEQISKLPDRCDKVAPSSIIRYIEIHNDCDKLIDFLNKQIQTNANKI